MESMTRRDAGTNIKNDVYSIAETLSGNGQVSYNKNSTIKTFFTISKGKLLSKFFVEWAHKRSVTDSAVRVKNFNLPVTVSEFKKIATSYPGKVSIYKRDL